MDAAHITLAEAIELLDVPRTLDRPMALAVLAAVHEAFLAPPRQAPFDDHTERIRR